MKTARQRALDYISAAKYYGASFGDDELMFVEALEKAFKEQDRDTRHACAEAVASCGDAPAIEMIDRAHNACMNVKAV